jgi:hypothetical protein
LRRGLPTYLPGEQWEAVPPPSPRPDAAEPGRRASLDEVLRDAAGRRADEDGIALS